MAPQRESRWYTRQDLVEFVTREGQPIKARLVADWVSIGLLDKGKPRGRGKGKGKEYLWPEMQAQLLLLLLGKRGEAKRATLCNIPIAIWLIWGESYVPLRQVRRALRTWAEGWSTVSGARADLTARKVLETFDHPDATPEDRETLRQLIARAGYVGEVDPESVGAALARVADPHGVGLVRGPLGVTGTDEYVQTLVVRLRAIESLESAPKDSFLKARERYHLTGPLADPDATQVEVEGKPVSLRALGVEKKTFQSATNSACLDLITLLGLNL